MIKLFFKFNILLFSFLILSITNLYSEIIKDFKIIGNDRVNSETIKEVMQFMEDEKLAMQERARKVAV